MALAATFNVDSGSLFTAISNAKLSLYIEVLDELNNQANLNAFSDVVYTIKKADEVVLQKRLNDGITASQNFFVIYVPKEEITFEGAYTHSFVVMENGTPVTEVFNNPIVFNPAVI